MGSRLALVATLLATLAQLISSGCNHSREREESEPVPTQDVSTESNSIDSIPPPAWQSGNSTLAAKWLQVTGTYIFQQACTSCHTWVPHYWPRNRWEDYLSEFPGNHEPDVGDTYADLTAMFGVGAQVPTTSEQLDALGAFILAAAPLVEPSQDQREKKFHGVPEVGEQAPGFSIADIQGRKFTLSQFKGKNPLILVFSRAHW